MGIPISDEYYRNMVVSVQIEEAKREVALRTQDDYRVFISYSHLDRDTAKHITEVFDRAAIRYVIDEKALEWGDKIGDTVRTHLTACTHYLLILSEASAQSQWCSYEYGLADGQGKKVLIVLVGAVSIPSFAARVLATADLNVVEDYFRRQLIDVTAVDRFIAELLDDGGAKLDTFRRVGEADGRTVWDSPRDDRKYQTQPAGRRGL
jgi:TIR domain